MILFIFWLLCGECILRGQEYKHGGQPGILEIYLIREGDRNGSIHIYFGNRFYKTCHWIGYGVKEKKESEKLIFCQEQLSKWSGHLLK